jgi:hypothetical protein
MLLLAAVSFSYLSNYSIVFILKKLIFFFYLFNPRLEFLYNLLLLVLKLDILLLNELLTGCKGVLAH